MTDPQDYQSLNDPNLNAYFKNKRIRQHLIKAKLINRQGDILPASTYEVVLARRAKRKQAKQKLSHTITHYVIEEERKRQAFINDQIDLVIKRSLVKKIRESDSHRRRSVSNSLIHLAKHSRSRNARTPSPRTHKSSPVRPKSAHHSPINVKNQLAPRPTSAKKLPNDEYCQVTMIYYGPQINLDHSNTWLQPNGDEVVVMQQHCGGENLVVFKGFVRPNETFTFESRRHPGYPFAVAIYINGLIDSRISVCCEYKHKHNVRLGSNRGLFGIFDVKKSRPCPSCEFAKRKKKILSMETTTLKPSLHVKPVGTRVSFTTEFGIGNLLRTPDISPEREREPSKGKTNRISTEAQASLSPTTVSSTSTQNKDKSDESKNKNSTSIISNKLKRTRQKPIKTKKDDTGKLSRVSSTNSKKSGPHPAVVSFKNEHLHKSSEPLFVRRNSDDEDDQTSSTKSSLNTTSKKSASSLPIVSIKRKDNHSSTSSLSSASRKPGPSPTPIFNDKDDRRSSKSSSNASTKSESTPIPIFNDEDDRHSLKSSSRNSRTTPSVSIPIFDNKHDKHSLRLSSSSSIDEVKQHSPKISTKKTDDDHLLSSSSSSDTLKGSNTSMFEFFSEKKSDHHAPKISPEQISTDKEPSRSSSNTSKTSNSLFKNKPDGKLFKEESGRLSSTEVVDRPLSPDNQHDIQRHLSLTSSEKSDRPNRSSISSTNNQQTNDLNTQNPPKTDSISSDDTKLKPIPKPKRRNEEDESSTNPDKGPVRQYRSVENIVVVWLDAALKEPDNETLNSKVQLRQIARTLRTYDEPEKCLQLFKEIKTEKIFLIVSGRLSEEILQQIGDHSQLAVVYIFCQESLTYEPLMAKYPKIKGIYTDKYTICEHLKMDAKQWENDLNTFQAIPLVDDNHLSSEQILFIQNQLFKEYLLEIQYDKDSIHDLVDYCKNLYAENDKELEIIKQFEDDYNPNDALYWYTKDCFAYHMLNRAIRTKDIKILFQMGFFIRDINQKLQDIHSTTLQRSTLTVYRGQGMKFEYFEELKRNQGGLISFNGFLSTSKKRNVADDFARRSLSYGFPIGVIFRIKIDPKNTSSPSASLENLSSTQSEYEILFSFKTIFHIESIEQMENNLWQVDLTLINEKENQISAYIQIERTKFNHLTDFEKLGELLIEMNELDKAKDLYEVNIPPSSNPKYTLVYKQLALIFTKLEVYNQALLYYNLALKTKSNETLNDYVTISNIHIQIGKIFHHQNKTREALEEAQFALNIQLEHLASTHPSLASTYELLAMIFEENEDYERALEYYQKQLDIQEKSDISIQSELALTHFKIAICLENLDQFNEAMDHIQQSMDMSPDDDFELSDRQTVLERIREQLE